MSVDWVGYGYAALVASGGVIGYVKAGMCGSRCESGGRLPLSKSLKSVKKKKKN